MVTICFPFFYKLLHIFGCSPKLFYPTKTVALFLEYILLFWANFLKYVMCPFHYIVSIIIFNLRTVFVEL